MSIIFSRQCEYALQAVSYLALQPAGKKTSIRELTRKLKIPYHFLAKILQNLTYKKLLVSQKGPSGGFALALPPDMITLFHVVEAIDGSDFASKCVMGFQECSNKCPCAIHKHWALMREGIYSMLVSENIAEMAKAMKKPEYVCK
jgi:Rrf2 family transcriptional regulator, iron-sulfur cluster assembly transcription factor